MINELTEQQYNKILRFWKHIKNIEKQLDELEPIICNYMGYSEADEINWKGYEVSRAEHDLYEQDMISTKSSELLSKLDYYNNEYVAYINSIGFVLGDYSQSEILFQLLNHGIIIDAY